jgi:hypothetical protein
MPNNFYVYSHIKKTSGKCFYIGKGKGNRYITPLNRNRYWKEIVNKHDFISIILVNNINEEKAFELESSFCNQIGYKNLTNIRKEMGWGGHSHQPETILKLSKPVFQYDLDKNFIRQWNSATLASQHLNKKSPAAITECCRGIRKSIYGFIWRHVDNPINELSKYTYKKSKKQKLPPYYNPINQYDLKGNFIKTWNNIKEASHMLKIKTSSISQCINGKYKTSGGFVWSKLLNKEGGHFA